MLAPEITTATMPISAPVRQQRMIWNWVIMRKNSTIQKWSWDCTHLLLQHCHIVTWPDHHMKVTPC